MKVRQKIYDSSERINKLIKITNSYHLYKNLDNIRNRKPIYIYSSNFPLKKSNRQKSFADINEYNKAKDNFIFGKIIDEINSKKVGPPKNNELNYIINNSKESRLIYKNIENKSLKKENENYKKRIYSQKAFISAKTLDQEYKKRVIIGKLKNENNNRLILPPINKY